MEVTICIEDGSLSEAIMQALQDVKDPELPAVSLLELGMVHTVRVKESIAYVELLPTFIGCPALDMIKGQVHKRLSQVEGIKEIDVQFSLDIPWTTNRVTDAGIIKLREFGIASPQRDGSARSIPNCPYCDASDTQIENLFGPTACRSLYYCNACLQPFEGMKRI